MTVAEDFTIRAVSKDEARALVPELANLLVDAVGGGASVTFLAPVSNEKAIGFWERVAEADDREILVAFDGAKAVGTVQVVYCQQENQPHRAEIAKMLVHSSYRRRGLGTRLLEEAEKVALSAGRTLLVLDTEKGGPGEKLYSQCGWIRVGEIPNFALFSDGSTCATIFFYKQL